MSGTATLGMTYGVLLAAAAAAPQPLGLGLFWAVVALQLGLFSMVLWRRTRLPFATAGMVASAAGSLLSCGLNLTGYRWPAYSASFPGLPMLWAAPVLALLIAGPVCLFVESRVNRTQYRAWRQRQKEQGVWGLIAFRDVPDMRRRQQAGPGA